MGHDLPPGLWDRIEVVQTKWPLVWATQTIAFTAGLAIGEQSAENLAFLATHHLGLDGIVHAEPGHDPAGADDQLRRGAD